MCVMFFFKQMTAYVLRIRDWSSDVCSSDLAFTGEGLREREIKLVSDLTAVSPGAVFISSGASTNPTLTIRGQTKGYGPGLPAVLTYLNEVPLPAYSSLLPTFDISSVQILKGLQGTLLRRNTNGGAVPSNTFAYNSSYRKSTRM